MGLLAIARNHNLDPRRRALAAAEPRETLNRGAGAFAHVPEEREPRHLIGEAPEHEDREDEIVDDALGPGPGKESGEDVAVVEIVLDEEERERSHHHHEQDEVDDDLGTCTRAYARKKTTGHILRRRSLVKVSLKQRNRRSIDSN